MLDIKLLFIKTIMEIYITAIMIDKILKILFFFLFISGLFNVSAGEYKIIDISENKHNKYLIIIFISIFKASKGQSINKRLEKIKHK